MPLDMNPEIRARWTAALRSGDYQRGSGYLHTWDDRFCCLGVLCDLAVKAGVVKRSQAAAVTMHRYDDAGHYLPPAVQDWAGLRTENPAVPGVGLLSNMNDDGCSFAQIADAIDGGAS